MENKEKKRETSIDDFINNILNNINIKNRQSIDGSVAFGRDSNLKYSK